MAKLHNPSGQSSNRRSTHSRARVSVMSSGIIVNQEVDDGAACQARRLGLEENRFAVRG